MIFLYVEWYFKAFLLQLNVSEGTNNPYSLHVHICLYLYSKTDAKPWIQVDFLKPKLLSGVVTQGAGKSQNWVKAYQIFTSLDGINFRPYSDKPGDTTPKTYTGNNDSVTPVRHLFNRNITAQFIRLYPVHSHTGTPALRWNVIGCNPDTPKPLVDSQAIPTPSPGVSGQHSPTPQPGSDKQGLPTFSHHTQSTLEPSAQGTGIPTPAPCKYRKINSLCQNILTN
jgi:hypothetical protein